MTYLDQARARARRRRSPWNLILIPAVLIPLLGLWYCSAYLLGALYRVRHPGTEFVLLPDSLAGIVLATMPLFAWLAPAMIVGNHLAWLIPPARRAFTSEAKAFPGTSLTDSTRGLARYTRFLTPAALALAFAAAVF